MVISSHPFDFLETQATDPIFGLLSQYQSDPRPTKVNLGIGVYCNEHGHLPELRSVRLAKQALQSDDPTCAYLPMAGNADYCAAALSLLFGSHCTVDRERLAIIQTLGGTGALRIGADVLKQILPKAEVWVSDPGWDNHQTIFSHAGFTLHRYPYAPNGTHSIDFTALLACLERLPAQSIVVLHACCHNPTGLDLSEAQWMLLAEVIQARELIPFLDFAYQGFARGIDEDAIAVRLFADNGIAFLVAQSFSKNFALYGERCGTLTFYCQNAQQAERARAQMAYMVRGSYSNPPQGGAKIIARILLDAELNQTWRQNVDEMRQRIDEMRRLLVASLTQNPAGLGFQTLLERRGMFVTTGLSSADIDQLRSKFGVYLVQNGRLCLAGLKTEQINFVSQAILEVIRKGLM